MTPTLVALLGFVSWTLVLLIAMEAIRSWLVLTGALAAGTSSLTDPLAWVLLGARVVQSLIHLACGSSLAVTARFCAFAVQMLIAAYWALRLYAS